MIRNINKYIIQAISTPKFSSLINYKNIINLSKFTNNMDSESHSIEKWFDPSKYEFSNSQSRSQNTKTVQVNNNSIKYMFGSKKSNKFSQIKNENNIDQQHTRKLTYQNNEIQNDLQKTQRTIYGLKQKNKKQDTIKAIETLKTIKQWRGEHIAPVDVVGCQRLHEQHQTIQIQKYQTLIALILSVQTKDETTARVMTRLKTYGLTAQKMASIDQDKLLQMIRQSNFNRRKTKNIIEVSKIIVENGLPKSKEQLLNYPGVGMKIAMLYLKVAQKVTQGIGVDTHVHRISNRLGWVKNTKNPNQTQQRLQQLFPKQYWDDINICLVGFGQILCQAKKPKCKQCPVSNQCPSSTYKQLF